MPHISSFENNVTGTRDWNCLDGHNCVPLRDPHFLQSLGAQKGIPHSGHIVPEGAGTGIQALCATESAGSMIYTWCIHIDMEVYWS